MKPRLADHVRAAAITVFGCGHAPFASGTWGSAGAIAIFVGILALAGPLRAGGTAVDLLVLVPGVVISSALCVIWGDWAIARYASSDPKPFVLDEFAGQWLALLALPGLSWGSGWLPGGEFLAVLFVQFVLFRVMDVLKPPPAYQIQRVSGGWGVLLDDLFAGLYANLAGQLIWRLTPAFALVRDFGGGP